jgi:membrane protein implicated in regulation of membrane protease activity
MATFATPWWIPGAMLILFGLAIVIFPELLALIVASALIFAGANLLVWGHWMRRAQQRSNSTYINRTIWF